MRERGGAAGRPWYDRARGRKPRPAKEGPARAQKEHRTRGRTGELKSGGARGGRPERITARERVLTARPCALAVLQRAAGSGLFVSELLDREFRRGRMRPDDRGLATELAYGCLRMRGTLDRAIEQSAGRPMERISPELRDILRLGMYQLLFLDRIPAYAAVDEAVKLALRRGRPGAEKFVNAVLRNAPRSLDEVKFPDRGSDPVGHIATRLSHPAWLVRRWIDRMGEAEAEALCAAGNAPPPLTARVNTVRVTREGLIAALAGEGVRAVLNAGHPLAVDIEDLPRPLTELASFRNGLFSIQDVSGMRVADLVGARGGERIVDLCAGPGGKATALAATAGDRAEVVCLDSSGEKAAMVREHARRLGLASIRAVVGDGREAPRIQGLGGADRVLVDAPCSNTGVLRRRPEARWRLRPGDIGRLAKTQRLLLSGGAAVARPGGVLVYSTCSVEPEENEGVVEGFLAENPGFEPAEELKLSPRTSGCDGGYAAKMIRKA